MAKQNLESVKIEIDKNVLANVGQLGVYFRNIEKIYVAACLSFGLSGSALKLKQLDIKKSSVELEGLNRPLYIAKHLIECRPKLLDKSQSESADNSDLDLELDKLFKHIATGANKVKKKDLLAHVKNSLNYWSANRSTN